MTTKLQKARAVGDAVKTTKIEKAEKRTANIHSLAEKKKLDPQDVALVISMFDDIDKAPPQYKMIDGVISYDNDDPVTFHAKIGAAIGFHQQAPKQHIIAQVTGLFADPQSAETTNIGVALIDHLKPKTPLESLLAVQMVGCHNAAVEMMRRALHPGQTPEGAERNSNLATKLMRTFTAQIEALSRLRGKGQQTVRVEHVTVNAGGQAIVGNVEHKAGGEG